MLSNFRSDIDKPCFDLFWGRKDCDTSPITSDQFEFPQPTMNSTQVFDYFRETFNLDVAEVRPKFYKIKRIFITQNEIL